MRVAGKGGAGKTTISETIARILARRGQRVVAVDGDGNPDNGYELVEEIPGDPALRKAESAAVAPIELAASSVSVRVIESLAVQFEERIVAIQAATA